MTEKNIRLGRQYFKIQGLSSEDPYFVHLRDDIEQDFQLFLDKYVSHDATSLDIGANIGATSLMLAAHLKSGSVHCFEPAPSVYEVLIKNLTKNNVENVVPNNMAVASEPNELHFLENSAYGHLSTKKAMGNISGTIVKVTSVDQYLSENKVKKLDFVKIDVEGFEFDVLKGMKNTIKTFSPLIYLEFNSWCLIAHNDTNPRDFLSYLLDEFRFVYFFEKEELITLSRENLAAFLHQNLVHRGCVDNLVVTNDEAKLNLTKIYLEKLLNATSKERDRLAQERDRLTQERDKFKNEIDQIINSKSWRLARKIAAIKQSLW